MRQSILSVFARCRCRPFVLGAMVGMIVNLGFVPLLSAPAAAAGPAPVVLVSAMAQAQGPRDPAPADPGGPYLQQQKHIYQSLFGGDWEGDGSLYDLPKVPTERGLLPALNCRNKLVAVLETVAIAPLNLDTIDNNSLGLPPEDVALLDAMDPFGNLIVGRLSTDAASVDIVAVALEWNIEDPELDVPTLIVMGSFDSMLSAGGVFTPEDYAGDDTGLAALAAAQITCPDGRVVQADGLYNACIAAADLALAACLAAALAALAVCIAKVIKIAAKMAKVCRWILIPQIRAACYAAIVVFVAGGIAFCAGVAAAAGFVCWAGYNEAVELCKGNLCSRTAPKVANQAQAQGVATD